MNIPLLRRSPTESVPASSVVKPEQPITTSAEADNVAAQQIGSRRAGDVAVPASSTDKPDRVAPKHILEGPVWLGVLKVAIPSVAAMVLTTLNGFLDRWFVGHLGADVLAAVTSANSLMFALMSASMGVSVGTSALVSRFVGEGNAKEAVRATHQSLLLGVLLSVLIGIPMWILRHPMLTALGVTDVALRESEAYLLVTVAGLPTLFLMMVFNGAFRGLGDTIRPLWITGASIVVHAIFNWLLIFGNLGFPKMGLMGGAVALVLSQVMSVTLYAILARQTPLRAMPWTFSIEWEWAARVLKIGLPAAAQQLIRVGSMLVFQAMLTRLGAGNAALAALGVGLLSESIAFMPGFGYSIAASAFVGQNLGARQIRRAELGAYSATLQAVIVMSVMGAVFWTFAEPFARFFIQHGEGETVLQGQQTEEAIRLTVLYLRSAAWSEPFLGVVMVLNGALQGAGETTTPTVFTFIAMVLIRLPLTWILAVPFGFGVHGAWWAFSISTMINSVFVFAIFRRGRWRTIRV